MENPEVNLLDCADLINHNVDVHEIISLVEKTFRIKFLINIVCISAIKMSELNGQYRQKYRKTNVLSFHYEENDQQITGEVYFCPEVIQHEAAEANITVCAHYQHLLVHALLHLIGYDHIKAEERELMESEEIKLLSIIGVNNPYEKLDK